MVAMTQAQTLGQFILDEMRQRDMSAREFADFIGVTHTIINKFLNFGLTETYAGRPVGYPSVEFLIKLSLKTKTDICALMAMVAPEVAQTTAVSPKAMITGQRVEQLPDTYREVVDDLIQRHGIK